MYSQKFDFARFVFVQLLLLLLKIAVNREVVYCQQAVKITSSGQIHPGVNSLNGLGDLKAGVGLVGTYVDIITGFVNIIRANEDIEDSITIHSLVGQESPLIFECGDTQGQITLPDKTTYNFKTSRKFSQSYFTCCNFYHGDKKLSKKSIEIRGGGTHNLDIFVYSYEFYIEGDKDIRLRSSWSSWTGGKSTVCTTLERKEIWIYTDKSFKGEKDRVEMNGSRGPCFNLNFNARNYAHGKDRNDQISSVALQGNCMRFYEHQGCLGEYLQLSPGVKEDCQENLENCPGWNDRISSIAPCDVDLPALYDNPRGSRNGRCKDACWPRGTDYFWCNLEGGSWDYCSPRPGQDYYGDMCRGTDSKGSCGYHGEAYRWCYTKEGGAATNRHWGYCS